MVDIDTKKKNVFPKCLNLRVHSSILLPAREGEEDNNKNCGGGDILFPSDILLGWRKRSGRNSANVECKANYSHDGRVFTIEENAGISNVFVREGDEIKKQGDSKNKKDDKNIKHRFVFEASSASERIFVQPSVDKIKEYGRRARDRSEQQRQNRKGIKVIDGSSLMVDQTQKQAKRKASSSNIHGGKKRLSRNSTSQKSHETNAARTKGLLCWTPDVSQIPIPSKDSQSSFIQLHGVPIGSTIQSIRKFFTGLIPERILVLLTNRTDIPKLDSSSYDDLLTNNLQNFIYTSKDVRILVKFDSVSAAELAADRSGETLSSKHVGTPTLNHFNLDDEENLQSHGGTDGCSPDCFSLGVTKMSKDFAFSLSKLSFDAVPGVPFHKCLSDVESKLNPKVREILWTSAGKACQLPVDSRIKSAKILIETAKDEKNASAFHEYKKHSIHYNRLLQIQDDLMAPMRSEKPNESYNSMDPVERLTANACKVLDDEMDRIDNLLYQYRASRLL